MAFARQLTSDDWRLWSELRLRALADDPIYATALIAERELDEAGWRQRLLEPGTTKVAGGVQGAHYVGILAGFVHQNLTTAEVFSVWVDPAARGCGVASAMLAAAEGWALKLGCSLLTLKVFESNALAQRLYAKCGFSQTPYRGTHAFSGLPEFEMIRRLE